MTFTVCPMNRYDAEAIVRWRYHAPYDLYDLNAEDADHDIRSMVDRANGYSSIHDDRGDLVAFICFGEEARVAGGDYREEALDVGWGIRPDLTGQGLGPVIVETALDVGRQTDQTSTFRATIAAFNQRALKAAQKVGFVPRRTFHRPSDNRPFVILTREAERSND